ncbi:MAG: hypothetical protein IJU72_00650 [Bacteroidales bacterium]|nr:hypothetical protein [Bacteroidales bacterium]
MVETKQEILHHYGPLSYDEIGYLLNKMMEKFNAYSLSLRKKVYTFMVESLENVYRHQDVMPESTNYYPRFTLWMSNDTVLMSVSNTVLQSKCAHISKCLDRVGQLDKSELKELYRDIILHGTISEKGGAGLGFVNMARVADGKLGHSFEPIAPSYSYFTIDVAISFKTNSPMA